MNNHQLVLVWLLLCAATTVRADGYFWHLTDMHFDPTYNTDQDSCNEVLGHPGRYGDYECDAPYELVESSVYAMKQLGGRDPQFILYTGDNPHHPKNRSTSDISSTEYVMFMLKNMTALFHEAFPDAQFVMTIGNHDYYPKDQLPGETNPLYEELAEMWKPHFNYSSVAVDTFKRGAYYTQMIDAELKIRIVVINTNLYLAKNLVNVGDPDPAGQYVWFESVLLSARQNGEKVHVIGHVPTGVMPADDLPMWLREEDNIRLNNIIRTFSDVISAYYGCHEHLDSFRLFYKDGEPVVPLFVTPSVTPWRARLAEDVLGPPHNPGIRKITYDEFTGELMDIEQYYLDLTRANSDDEDKWRRLYGFRAQYGIDNIRAPNLHGLVERFKQYGNTDFHNYYDMSTVGAKGIDVPPCSCSCKFLHICSIQNVDYASFTECYNGVTCGTVAPPSASAVLTGIVILISKLFL